MMASESSIFPGGNEPIEPSATIRLLLVEDSINDTFLIVRELQRSGLIVDFERVETAAYLQAALETKGWDLVICDYCLPQFDGAEALAMYRDSGLDAPFIMVSGMLSEDYAREVLRAGAHDYVPKDNLARLGPSVRRSLRAAQERRAMRGALPAEGTGYPAQLPPAVVAATAAQAPSTTDNLKPAA
jgi:DNA-binding NtrC family response regulator